MRDTDFEVDMEVIVEKIEKENRIYRIMEGMDLA